MLKINVAQGKKNEGQSLYGLTLCCSSCPVEQSTRVGLVLTEDLCSFCLLQRQKKTFKGQDVTFGGLSICLSSTELANSDAKTTKVKANGFVAFEPDVLVTLTHFLSFLS